MTSDVAALKPGHQRFADEYLIDLNAGAAYVRAGYKAKGSVAWAAASRLLARTDVQVYLSQRQAELAQAVQVTQEEVVKRLAFMALGDIRCLRHPDGRLKELHELTAEEASLIQGFEIDELYGVVPEKSEGKDAKKVRKVVGRTTKFKLVDRLGATKTLGLHLGMFKKQVEHSGPGGGPIKQEHSLIGDLIDMVEGADTGPGPAASRR